MKKQLLAGTLAFGLVGGSLVGAPLQEGNTVEAASWDCQITIDANKHDFTNMAKGKGSKKACGELEGYYTPNKTFSIMYPEPYSNLSNGEILKDVIFGDGLYDVKVNTIGEKTEKPQEPKPDKPKEPKPEKPTEPKPEQPKPEQPKDPKPEKPTEPKPEQPKEPQPEKPSEQPSKPTPEKPEPEKPSTEDDKDKGTTDKGKDYKVTNDDKRTQKTEDEDVNTIEGEENEKDEDGVVAGNDNGNNNNNNNNTEETNKGNNVDNKTTESKEVIGEKLPDTATNTYNLGLLGGMLALLGSAVGFVFNRKAKMD